MPPYEHWGRFSYGDLDGFPPLISLKSLYLSLTLILSGLNVLNLTLCLPYIFLSLKRILYKLILSSLTSVCCFPFEDDLLGFLA